MSSAEHDQLVLCFARFCWRNRSRLTPSALKARDRGQWGPAAHKTWGDRFEEMAGTTLDKFKDEQLKKKQEAA